MKRIQTYYDQRQLRKAKKIAEKRGVTLSEYLRYVLAEINDKHISADSDDE